MPDNEFIVSYWWQPPTPPTSPGPKPEPELAFQAKHIRLPRVGQVVTWILPSPRTVGQEPPLVIARGEVTHISEIDKTPGSTWAVLLARAYQGLSYEELCACIHAEVVGFHPDFGPIEGRLVGLLPSCELAGIADPMGGLLIEPDEEDEEDEPVVWVDWSTIWTVAGLDVRYH